MFAAALCVMMSADWPMDRDFDWLFGRWTGSITASDQFLPTAVTLTASREGRLIVIELERRGLLGPLCERIVFEPADGESLAVSDAPYAPAPRRDRVTLRKDSLTFTSDPWAVGAPEPLRLVWSLSSGRYIPAPRPEGRMFVSSPRIEPDPNSLVMTWSGRLGDKALGQEVGTLSRLP